MPTPLASFSNTRLLFTAPGVRGGPEVGYRETPGQAYLVAAFLKQASEQERAKFQNMTDLKVSTEFFKGYILGYCPIDAGTDYKTHAYESDGNYVSTGLRPDGMEPPGKVEATIGHRELFNCELVETAGVFDDLGIGATVREVMGDRLIIKVERY